MEIGNNAREQLRSLVQRIERLSTEKDAITADMKELYAEAKGNGFNPKILRKVLALRKKDQNQLADEQAEIDLYWGIVGSEVLS